MTEKPFMDENKVHLEGGQVSSTGENNRQRGKLKVFISYAPGSGKTLAMLENAYRLSREGTNVVVGYINHHGDLLAMRLLENFEVLPNRIVTGSGISYHGMDLDAILSRKPQVVLVDHLALANPPGLRHEMRYREVEELLNAGIDVFTTVNIYQLESQVDAVAHLTGVVVHETVPDHLVESADQIEMVDIPPQELLERYRSGHMFVPPRAEMQIEKFFQPSSLFALRELTLRYVARRSNVFMRSYLNDKGIPNVDPSSPRLLVSISDSLEASRLIRSGRRMADETRAEWTVVHIETPDRLERDEESQSALSQNMRLADLLGAQTEVLTGGSVAETLRDYALKHHFHRIMIGRSSRRHWYQRVRPTLAEQLLREDPTISLYVVGSDYTPRPFQMPRFWRWITRSQILGSLLLVIAPTLLGLALTPTIISRSANLIMLYLFSVVIASIFLGLVPGILTAVLSVLAFNFFFVPPYFGFVFFAPEYAITFVTLLVISIVISTLVARERALTRAAQRRADQVTQLYELSRDLAIAVDMSEILETILTHVRRAFDREAVILLPKNGELALVASTAGNALDSSEITAAEWAFQQGRAAGYNTGTFSYAKFRYFPLETSQGNIGVLGVRLAAESPEMDPEQVRLLGAYVTKAASSIERALFAEEASQTEILRATEKLQTALLNSISHDLRTPLASITGVLTSLRMEDDMLDPESRRDLVETAAGEAERLNRLVGNLLDMSRLESGTLKISLQPCDIQDVIGSALNVLNTRLEGHPVKIDLPADLPLVPLDFVLIQQVLVNLLDNAAKYSSEDAPIEVDACLQGSFMQVQVSDHGPGIPEEDLERIFEKFYRVKRFENVVGTGLGLSICKGIVEVHGGKIWAENRQTGGAKMAFSLPLKPATRIQQATAVQEIHEEMRQ